MTVLRMLIAATVLSVACSGGVPGPAALESGDACQHCRMVVVDQRFASQIVAPYEDPRFFDDLGCLSNYLKTRPSIPSGAAVYVADHRTRNWVRAEQATFSSVETLTAPMGSHVVAHQSESSRDADADATLGRPVSRAEIFPAGLVEGLP